MSKFQDDPMVNKSKIIIYWKMFKCMWEKERILKDEEERTNLGRRKSVETYVDVKPDLIYLYL